jgi:hypothetical protein
MTTGTYRGIVRDGTIILLEKETPLTDGTEVLITPLPGPGTSAAILAAMEDTPPVPPAWIDELEQLIAAGQHPPSRETPFAPNGEDGEDR